MTTRLAALAAAVVAAVSTSGSGAAAPEQDAGLIIFTVSWRSSLDADPYDDVRDTTSVLCGVDRAGQTYGLTMPDLRVGAPVDPGWAPDGIRYAATSVGHVPGLVLYGIIIRGLDGTRRAGPSGRFAAWSPDGTRIAFSPQTTGGIAVSPADAGPGAQGTRIAPRWGRASWSPDGSELVVADGGEVRAVRVDGGGERLVLRDAHEPDWSPDGTVIAVARVPVAGGRQSIAIVRADGTGLRDLGIAGSSPTWSPSGTQLAYVDERGGIVVAGVDGSLPLTLFRGWAGGQIDWQPVPHPELLADRPPCPVLAPPPDVHTIEGSVADDNIWGTSLADTIRAGNGHDVVLGDEGDDTVAGDGGADQIDAGPGDDRVEGGPGHDLMRGGPGDDAILARDGERDSISCGPGKDDVVGDALDQLSTDCERARGADLLLGDKTAPAAIAGGIVTQLNYVNGRSSYRANVRATDGGSGVARVWIVGPRGRVFGARSGHCRPTRLTRVRRGRACGPVVELTTRIDMRTLPEGVDRFRVVAVDAAGNRGARAGWTLYVDKTPPRARHLRACHYDRKRRTAWLDVAPGGDDPNLPDGTEGSGVIHLVYQYRVNTGKWTKWIDPDGGSFETFTPVIEARGVLPGDIVHAQIRETDGVGNVGPAVQLSARVRGTERWVEELLCDG